MQLLLVLQVLQYKVQHTKNAWEVLYTIICLLSFTKFSLNNTLYDFNIVRGGIVWKYFLYENFARMESTKLHAALLSVHEQTHVYARQALNHGVNMFYASELKKLHDKIVNGK